jgi:molybdopterin synthase sulfur carrier subunit
MSVTVSIPTILRGLTRNEKYVEATGTTVREVIASIEKTYPGVKSKLVSGDEAHRFVNIYVNDEDIRFLGDLGTPVKSGDVVTVLPAVAGGSGQC